MEHFCTRGMDVVLYSTHFLYSSDIAVVSNSPGHTLAQCCFLSRTDLCSARFLVLHRWGAGPWRSPPTWTCCPGPEHISPAEAEKMKTVFFFHTKLELTVTGETAFLTFSPGSGFSWALAAASLASCSSFLRVWMAVSAESISMGPQASCAWWGKKKKVLTLKWQ